MKRNDCKMDKIKIQVAACCILHNLCESNEYRDEWTALPETQLYEASEQRVNCKHFDNKADLLYSAFVSLFYFPVKTGNII